MSDLITLKVRKLGQQRELANEFNRILTCQGGLNDQTHQTCKNLEYAIAISTRPGQIEYYQPPEETTRVVETGELAVLTKKMANLQREIDQVEQDIQQAAALTATSQVDPSALAPSCSNLAEWFAEYGEPGPPAAAGLLTSFEESPKIYGGTNHHRAFRTQATVMKKGRLTR